MHSPHSIRFLRITSLCALLLILAFIGGVGLLAAPRIASSEEPASSDTYVVQAGDTLTDIAARFGTTVGAIANLNGLDELNHIVSGTKLTIPAQAAASSSGTQTYKVQSGDTLSGIADTFGVDVSSLATANGLTNENRIVSGTELTIPVVTVQASMTTTSAPDRKHSVEAGETLSSIASDYGVTVRAIAAANDMDDTDLIRVGQLLVIPSASLPELSPQTATIIQEASSEFGVDRYLLLALSLMESGWQSQVVSHTGAIGLMQLMPDTAEWTVDNLTPTATNWHISIEDNARVGAAYFNHLLFLEGGDVEGALASYYQGWASYKSDGMFDETRDYVDDVLALADRLGSEGD